MKNSTIKKSFKTFALEYLNVRNIHFYLDIKSFIWNLFLGKHDKMHLISRDTSIIFEVIFVI